MHDRIENIQCYMRQIYVFDLAVTLKSSSVLDIT